MQGYLRVAGGVLISPTTSPDHAGQVMPLADRGEPPLEGSAGRASETPWPSPRKTSPCPLAPVQTPGATRQAAEPQCGRPQEIDDAPGPVERCGGPGLSFEVIRRLPA